MGPAKLDTHSAASSKSEKEEDVKSVEEAQRDGEAIQRRRDPRCTQCRGRLFATRKVESTISARPRGEMQSGFIGQDWNGRI